jgi:ribosome maturation factor RimP
VQRHVELEKVVLPVVTGLGYQFVGLQQFPQGKHSVIRLYIDKPGGVTIDDCERVSRQVNAALEVEEPYKEYALEVSSPGVDRLLFTPAQFREFIGKEISIRLRVPVAGKRNYKGILKEVKMDAVSIGVNEETVVLSFTDMIEARLVPVW